MVAAIFIAQRILLVLTRRSTLGLLAAAATMPQRAFAHVAPPRNEIRDSLAKRFTDLGTAGTFVGYKVEDYLIVASDKERSGEAKLPASTFKIPNSLIALETGVVTDPDKDVFPWDGVKRLEQIDFVDRLRRRALPISKRSQDLVADILPVTKVGDSVIRAKSGLLGAERGEPSLGWMVGWAEKGEAHTVFALNMDCKEPRLVGERMPLTQACLAEIGAI